GGCAPLSARFPETDTAMAALTVARRARVADLYPGLCSAVPGDDAQRWGDMYPVARSGHCSSACEAAARTRAVAGYRVVFGCGLQGADVGVDHACRPGAGAATDRPRGVRGAVPGGVDAAGRSWFC